MLENSGISPSSLTVINNPILFERTTETENQSKYIIYAGRISKEKGVSLLLEAWNKSELSDFDLYIVGEGNQKKILQNKYKSENIKFLGQIENREVLHLIKDALFTLDRYSEFEFILKDLVERDPRNFDALIDLADYYSSQGENQKSISLLDHKP